MRLTYAQLLRHIKPRAEEWRGFEIFHYEPRVLSVVEALACSNVWSLGKETVRDYVKRVGAEGLPPKAQAYAADFHDGPVFVVAFTLETLGRLWADKYPGATGNGLVFWDANHRTSALALRESRGIVDDHPVIVFVGAA
jgi:hypothetical protein